MGPMPICGTLASAATAEIASVAGVTQEPKMASTLSSDTKRLALVVALVGSPASSSSTNLTGTPPMVSGCSGRVFLIGIPSAAAGPVNAIEMPILRSWAWAAAPAASAMTPATKPLIIRNELTEFLHRLVRMFACTGGL